MKNNSNTMPLALITWSVLARQNKNKSETTLIIVFDKGPSVRWPVSRVLFSRSARDGHSSGAFVAECLARPTRTAAGNRHCRPYLVLLPVGLAVPSSLPKTRCALTAPFQPCLGNAHWRFAFCCAFPGVASAGRYPAPCFRGARTFLPP